MRDKRLNLARTGPVIAVFAFLTLVAAACAPPPAPTSKANFYSDASGSIQINVLVPGDPDADPPTEDETIPVDIDLTGQASGTWESSNDFTTSISLDGGSFPLDVPGIGTLTVTYSVAPAAAGTGSFDSTTGVGGFDVNFTVTVLEVDLLGPIAQPCDLGFGMSLTGQIDTTTGQLDVGQDGFAVTPPGATDCGGLGGVFGDLLGGPDNSASLSFMVGTL